MTAGVPAGFEASYWAFAFVQSLLLMSAIAAAALNLFWWRETRHPPRPPLRRLLLFIALLHGALAVEAGKWVAERALDPAFAVAVAAAILETRSYWGFVLVRSLYLALVAAQTLQVWRVRRLSVARFALLAATLAGAAVAATGFHRRQVAAHCAVHLGCDGR